MKPSLTKRVEEKMRCLSNVLIFACLFLEGCATREVGIMSWEAYEKLEVRWPYVMSLRTESGSLYYFGAAHTYDPSDPQLAEMERAWAEFRPDIAFTEGGFPPIEKSRDEAIRRGGESGLVRFLAARDDVPTTTLDPSRAEEIAALSGSFSREQLKAFLLLRSAAQFVARHGVENVEKEIDRILRIYDDTPGLRGSPRSVAELQRFYETHFPGQGSYASVPPSWFDPTSRETVLNEIARASSDYRDRVVVDRLLQHVLNGRRVFAVMGGSHVVMQEPALRSRMGDSRAP